MPAGLERVQAVPGRRAAADLLTAQALVTLRGRLPTEAAVEPAQRLHGRLEVGRQQRKHDRVSTRAERLVRQRRPRLRRRRVRRNRPRDWRRRARRCRRRAHSVRTAAASLTECGELAMQLVCPLPRFTNPPKTFRIRYGINKVSTSGFLSHVEETSCETNDAGETQTKIPQTRKRHVLHENSNTFSHQISHLNSTNTIW